MKVIVGRHASIIVVVVVSSFNQVSVRHMQSKLLSLINSLTRKVLLLNDRASFICWPF